MNQHKSRRFGTAVGFVSGVLACLDAVRDTRVVWPPMPCGKRSVLRSGWNSEREPH